MVLSHFDTGFCNVFERDGYMKYDTRLREVFCYENITSIEGFTEWTIFKVSEVIAIS